MATEITYNGATTSLEAGQTATLSCSGKKAVTDIVIAFVADGSITYNGKTTEIEAGKTATLLCGGKKFATDVVVSARAGLAAGLYETGTDTMLKSWDELLAEGTVHVEDGVVYTNFNLDDYTNASDAAIVGDLVLPDDGSITALGSEAVSRCTGLTSITIPDSVTSIMGWALEGCSGLTSVTFGDNSQLAFISESAFRSCHGLTSIVIPDSVTEIIPNAFVDCVNLTSITVSPNNTVYHSHSSGTCIIETATKALTLCCVGSTIPSDGSVTRIGEMAFMGCTWLTAIEIPDSVTHINSYAFDSCTELSSVEIPNSVVWFGSYAFVHCTGLTSVTIGSGVRYISNNAFEDCAALASIKIPVTVTLIEECAFKNCTALKDVYYAGTEEQWAAISIENRLNEPLLNATIHYNYTDE